MNFALALISMRFHDYGCKTSNDRPLINDTLERIKKIFPDRSRLTFVQNILISFCALLIISGHVRIDNFCASHKNDFITHCRLYC